MWPHYSPSRHPSCYDVLRGGCAPLLLTPPVQRPGPSDPRLPPEGCSVPEKVLWAVISETIPWMTALSLRIMRVTLNIWWLCPLSPSHWRFTQTLSLPTKDLSANYTGHCWSFIFFPLWVSRRRALASRWPVSGQSLASRWPVDRWHNVNSTETPLFSIVLIPNSNVRERLQTFALR